MILHYVLPGTNQQAVTNHRSTETSSAGAGTSKLAHVRIHARRALRFSFLEPRTILIFCRALLAACHELSRRIQRILSKLIGAAVKMKMKISKKWPVILLGAGILTGYLLSTGRAPRRFVRLFEKAARPTPGRFAI